MLFSANNGDEGDVAERAIGMGLRTLDVLVNDNDETILQCSWYKLVLLLLVIDFDGTDDTTPTVGWDDVIGIPTNKRAGAELYSSGAYSLNLSQG